MKWVCNEAQVMQRWSPLTCSMHLPLLFAWDIQDLLHNAHWVQGYRPCLHDPLNILLDCGRYISLAAFHHKSKKWHWNWEVRVLAFCWIVKHIMGQTKNITSFHSSQVWSQHSKWFSTARLPIHKNRYPFALKYSWNEVFDTFIVNFRVRCITFKDIVKCKG